jgi:hypothetical protein
MRSVVGGSGWFAREGSAKGGVGLRRSLFLHTGQQLTIYVEREWDFRMTKTLCDHLRIHTRAQQLRCVRMPKIVEADVPDLQAPKQIPVCARKCGWFPDGSIFDAAHEIMILVASAHRSLVRGLRDGVKSAHP